MLMSWWGGYERVRSVVADFVVQGLGALERGGYELAEDGLFLLELGELFLEVIILLLLAYHTQLERAVKRFNQRVGGLQNLLVYVLYFGAHRVQLLPEQLDQFVVFLQIFVGLARQGLTRKGGTSTMPR